MTPKATAKFTSTIAIQATTATQPWLCTVAIAVAPTPAPIEPRASGVKEPRWLVLGRRRSRRTLGEPPFDLLEHRVDDLRLVGPAELVAGGECSLHVFALHHGPDDMPLAPLLQICYNEA